MDILSVFQDGAHSLTQTATGQILLNKSRKNRGKKLF